MFRDRDLGGFAKALWLIGLIVVPFLSRADLPDRARAWDGRASGWQRPGRLEPRQTSTSSRWPGAPSSADEIASAKALLDDGTITEAEYERLKAKALA